MISPMMSSTTSRESLYCCGSQVLKSMTSWPALAWFSAASVRISLLPWLVMKSILTSTFSFSPHSLMSFVATSLAPGTQ